MMDRDSFILKNVKLIDPARKKEEITDLTIEKGIVIDDQPLSNIHPRFVLFDLSGYTVFPGLTDVHVHLRTPGFEYKEDITTGTIAAAAGGFTTLVAMPNTNPPPDSPSHLNMIRNLIDKYAQVEVILCGTLTAGRQGDRPSDISGLRQNGIYLFSDDGNCISDPSLMEEIAEMCAQVGGIILDHCENPTYSQGGHIRKGWVADLLRVHGIPPEAEFTIVQRDIEIAQRTGCHIHCQHLSCAESVYKVQEAQSQHCPISAEVTPHHICLTFEDILTYLSNAKMNPPLGTQQDQDALISALQQQVISIIATDHAPHAAWEKAQSLEKAPNGIVGLETALPLCYTYLCCQRNLFSLSRLLEYFIIGPAILLKRPAKTLSPGSLADFVVFKEDEIWQIHTHHFLSKARNSPFHRWTVQGRVYGTYWNRQWRFHRFHHLLK